MEDFICNKCNKGISIEDEELYDLYSEETHFINCPHCEEEICVQVEAVYKFETIDVED